MKLIVDSCVDFNEELLPQSADMTRIPFKITIDGVEYIDNGTDVTDELKKRQYKSTTIRTACPSPGEFYSAMKDAAESFVVSISSKLSGAYQSAMSALDVLQEEFGDTKKSYVFDSKSASAGENLIALKIKELIQNNEVFSQIVEKTEEYIDSLKTLFALDSLETLVSNGRVSKMEQMASKALKLFPIMGDDGDGNIERKAIARGEKNVIPKLIEAIDDDDDVLRERVLAITHVDALDKAERLKAEIEKTHPFKEIHIFEAGGLSSVYASKGGLVLAY